MTAHSAHPPDDQLVAFGLGKIDDPSAETVRAHLDTCPDCERRVARVTADSLAGRPRQPGETRAPGDSLADRPTAGYVALPPTTLPPELAGWDQYADVRELGRGGMGVVYLARNTMMDRPEVLKVINPAQLGRSGSVERFVREIQSAARLRHPNVVVAHSAQHRGGLIVFAMEYVPGEDLAKVVKARGPLPVLNACLYAAHAALGLQHAHEKGMVHRDIKPGNLILTREGRKHQVKVLDFGLAKGVGEADAGLTGEGKMLGTPDYIAPEQTLDAAHADIRSDIYSLGCTLYYLLAGRVPFSGPTLYALLQAHHEIEATRLSVLRPAVPDELAGVVARMMAKDPAARYQTPAEVAAALKPFLRPAGRPAPTPPRPGRPTMAAAPSPFIPVGRLEPERTRSLPPAPAPVAPPIPVEPAPPPMVVGPPRRRVRPRTVAVIGLVAVVAGVLVAWAGGAFVRPEGGAVELARGALPAPKADPEPPAPTEPPAGKPAEALKLLYSYSHCVNNGEWSHGFRFRSDGKITGPDGGYVFGTWDLVNDNRTLTLTWYNNGYTDFLHSTDGENFAGKNNNRPPTPIRGTLSALP